VPGARLLPCTCLIQSSSTLASFNRRTLASSSGGVNRGTCFERLAQNLCSSSRPPACSEFRLSLRSTQATMSGQKPSKSGFLTAPLRKLFKGSSKRSAQTTPSPSPSPSPQPGPIASSIPSVGPNSAAASNVSVVLVSESWWSKNHEEIVASVRQVLNVAKEALDGVPVPGLKAAVGGLTEGLKVFQVSDIDETMFQPYHTDASCRPSGATTRA
jgi:hypothetical protein